MFFSVNENYKKRQRKANDETNRNKFSSVPLQLQHHLFGHYTLCQILLCQTAIPRRPNENISPATQTLSSFRHNNNQKKTSLRGRSLPGERAIHFSLFLYHVRAFAFNDRGEGRENMNANGQTALAVMMVVLYPKITSRDQDAPQSYSRSCPRVLVRCDHAERFFLPLVRGKFIFVMISWCQSCEVQASQRVFTSEFSERPIRFSRAVFANKGADAISIRPDVIVQKIGA